eukprot:258426-Rhodomonas_salina.2
MMQGSVTARDFRTKFQGHQPASRVQDFRGFRERAGYQLLEAGIKCCSSLSELHNKEFFVHDALLDASALLLVRQFPPRHSVACRRRVDSPDQRTLPPLFMLPPRRRRPRVWSAAGRRRVRNEAEHRTSGVRLCPAQTHVFERVLFLNWCARARAWRKTSEGPAGRNVGRVASCHQRRYRGDFSSVLHA